MRQVFSSPRLHNVEGIAKMLEDNGIEVRITHGRSYKSAWSGRRTYRDAEDGTMPAVWVIRSEDQPRARQLLREAGLLDSTRGGSDSYLPDAALHAMADRPAPTPTKRAFRYKVALLIGIVAAVALAWTATHRMKSAPATTAVPAGAAAPVASAPAATASPATQPVAPPADPVPNAYPVETPPILATTLAAVEFSTQDAKVACLRIDGTPASPESLAQLPKSATRIDCTDAAGAGALQLDVRDYRTDGSGTGTVELAVTSAAPSGEATTQVRTLLVRRTNADWRVLRVLSVR